MKKNELIKAYYFHLYCKKKKKVSLSETQDTAQNF